MPRSTSDLEVSILTLIYKIYRGGHRCSAADSRPEVVIQLIEQAAKGAK